MARGTAGRGNFFAGVAAARGKYENREFGAFEVPTTEPRVRAGRPAIFPISRSLGTRGRYTPRRETRPAGAPCLARCAAKSKKGRPDYSGAGSRKNHVSGLEARRCDGKFLNRRGAATGRFRDLRIIPSGRRVENPKFILSPGHRGHLRVPPIPAGPEFGVSPTCGPRPYGGGFPVTGRSGLPSPRGPVGDTIRGGNGVPFSARRPVRGSDPRRPELRGLSRVSPGLRRRNFFAPR